MKFQITFLVLCLVASTFAEFECQNDVPYIENGCNGCNCFNKQLTCTLKGCIGETFTELTNCEVGKEWKHMCNECWCTKHLGTVCTNYSC